MPVQRRTLALLVYVADGGSRGVSRDRLISLLWPETSEERARHTLAQALYRVRQHFGVDAVQGVDVLRLDPALFTTDFTEFQEAAAADRFDDALALYRGPFLEGLALSGSPDFERWAEERRGQLAALHRRVLERGAVEAERTSDFGKAVERWRALANADPLNSHVAARLVRALVASRQRPAALKFARVHEALLRQELDAVPTGEFLAAVADARHRATQSGSDLAPPKGAPAEEVTPDVGVLARPASETTSRPDTMGHTAETLRLAVPRRDLRRVVIAAATVVLVAVAFASAYPRGRATRQIAVGHITDFTREDTAALGHLIPEMLTTNLSRLPGVDVVNRTTLFQLMGRGAQPPGAADFARAAEEAGVDQLLDGALYRRPDGMLRLDIRVLDLESGVVRQVHRVDAAEPFALADSATARIAAGLGRAPVAPLRVADVTTGSLVAYRFYEEGLRALRQMDEPAARRLFAAALAADSSFAMASYWLSYITGDTSHLRRARELSVRATEFEQRLIRAHWAIVLNEPSSVAVAESLTTRYPAYPESHYLLGQALHWSGDFAGALVAARHAIALDSMSLREENALRCVACDAWKLAISSYAFLDSVGAMERMARELARRQPNSPHAWYLMREALAWKDSAAALTAYHRQIATSRGPAEDFTWLSSLAIRWGDFAKAERLAGPELESPSPVRRSTAHWWRAIALRHQGRLEQALQHARQLRGYDPRRQPSLLEGQVLFDLGRYREAAAVFDAYQQGAMILDRSVRARNVTWGMTHKAAALAAAGDWDAVRILADSLKLTGVQSGYARDPRLHHHVRGLILKSEGRRDEAVAEFRRAIWSPVAGYTRTNLELGRLLLELNRPSEAVPVLSAALRGALESSNMYVTHTEVRALLARAYRDLRLKDSAAVHRRWVEAAIAGADPVARRHIARLLDG